MSLIQLKQLYYSLVKQNISYASLAWGSGFKVQLKKVQTEQHTVLITIFFATNFGKDTESAFPLMNLLNILSVTSILKLQALKFAHHWHIKALPNIFITIFNMLVIFIVMIRDMLVIKIFVSRAQGPTLENNMFLQL